MLSYSRATLISKAGLPILAVFSCLALCDSAPALAGSPPPAEAAEVVAQADVEARPLVEVIFTGFVRRLDKSASIFVRMTGEVPVVADRTGRRLTYRLSGAKLGVRNNANPLPTEHFGPPVSNVALVQMDGGVDLVIDLSSDPSGAAPSYRLVSQAGIATLHVELPAVSE